MICFNLTSRMFISSIVEKNERPDESEHSQEHQTNRSDQFNREWETGPVYTIEPVANQ